MTARIAGPWSPVFKPSSTLLYLIPSTLAGCSPDLALSRDSLGPGPQVSNNEILKSRSRI
jgi:hypothetical protein